MIFSSKEAFTNFLFITIVYCLFVVSAIMRAKKNWKVLNDLKASAVNKIRSRLGLVFEVIILTASILFYLVFIFNIGR